MEDLSRKGAKAKESPLETRQRFASLRLCARKRSVLTVRKWWYSMPRVPLLHIKQIFVPALPIS
jgi:hypothetical protein